MEALFFAQLNALESGEVELTFSNLAEWVTGSKLELDLTVAGAFWSILELKGHFIRADHVEVDERKNNRSMRIQCMPSGTRSNKEKDLLFSDDPAHLERTIRRGQRSASLDATTSSSIDTHNQPSTDTKPSSSIDPRRSTTIDITPRTSIDTVSSKMVNVIILTQDENGNLYDQDVDLRNATGQKIDAQGTSESNVDRHNTPPIDRQAPLTYRVRLPSINNDYINALKPPPKPLASPPEPKPNSLNSSPEPVQEDQETEGRWLRKRKEKIPKNLKREANDKEMDGFTKRILKIPIEKPFDEAYFTQQLWMFFRETKYESEYETEYEIEYSESIDTHTFPSIDSNESTMTDARNNTSLGVDQPVDHFALPNHCYPHFAFQPPSKRGRDDYCIGRLADSGFHESLAVDTVIILPNEEHREEYDEDYWKEHAIEMSLQDERFETHKFTNTFPTSFDEVHSTSVDTHPRPAKQPFTSIDTHTGTSIDIRAAAKIQKLENILSPTRDPDGNAHAINGRILQQRGTPDIIQTDPNKHVGVAAAEINPDLSCQPKGQASIDGTTQTSIDRITSTSTDKDDPTSIDRRYEFGYRAFDMYGARKFTWERRDEYGVYRDECGHAQGVAGEMIPVTKDDIRKLLERASLFEESHICLPEHATSFTLTRLAPELYTKDEINEMVTGICGAQEKLGEELKSLQLEKEATTSASIDAPHAPSIDVSLPTAQIPAEPQCSAEHKDEWEVSYINTRVNDVYYPLNNNVDWLSTKIELLQQDLDTIRKKDQQPATSIDVCTITSLDAKISAMDDRLQTYEDMHDRFISPANSSSIDRLRGPWIDGKNPVELLPYTAAEVDKITSKIYTAIDTMEERLDKRCDDIYFPFDNRIGGLDSHAEWLQKEVKAIQRQLAAQHQISASIDRKRAKSLDGKSPRSTDEHLIASIDAESTPAGEQLIHKTTYAYDNIGWHQVSIDNVQDRLQNISNVLKKMDDKWTRNDEATRNSTIDAKADQPINYTLALTSSKRDLEAAIFKARFHKEFLDIGQKEVNRAWWQPPLSFDSWKPVQSWSLILQWKQTLTQERKLEREKLGTNFYLQFQILV
ncbi:hypothetical protein IGI04_019461 [Brassica rapa subsp. trilocularis]|uniref:Aminotransferase-like plant mobile domain-containing protein n=1 Tax=Brassica rapa subsp. trilocularis TaxID=1813537 RepID=A0ABQ7MG94_BRACM|nr:hypothetical protein IGI04_019461 [Brassica rapa subsp. trilocularis]